MEQIFEKIDQLFVNGFLSGGLTILFSIILFPTFNRILNKLIERHQFQQKKIIYSVKKIILTTLFVLIVSSQFRFMAPFLNAILASGGILAVIIGLASQEAAGSIVSGAMILISKPFKIGDIIILKEQNLRGTVRDIKINHTVIETLEKNLIMIPNTTMNKAIIENLTDSGNYKVSYLSVDISYDSDLNKAIEIMQTVIASHPLFFDTTDNDEVKIPVHCMDFKDSSISLRAKITTKNIEDGFQICSDCRILIKNAFDEHKIEIPYPHIQIIQ